MNKESERKPVVDHLEDGSDISVKEDDEKNEFLQDIQDATDAEHGMLVRDALSNHKMAIFWSIVGSSTLIMEGYDTSLMHSFFAYPAFQKKYGELIDAETQTYELTGPWQVGLSCASSVGAMIGVTLNGYLIEKFGHRRVIMAALVLMTCFIFIPFFSPNIKVLVTGQVLNGIPWGIFATMGPNYASEICPLVLRGYLTAYTNMCWAIGQLIGAGVLRGLVDNTTEWGYRIPFAIQWVWPIPLFTLTYLAPDSPWWLVRRGKSEKAAKSLTRLWNKPLHHRVKQQVSLMEHTTKLEHEQNNSKTDDERGWKGYLLCFKGTNLRRTEIICIGFASQILSGSSFAYSPSYFFRQAGLNPDDVYKLNLGTKGISFSGCIVSWFLMSRFGRRTIFLSGYAIVTALLLVVGILASPEQVSALQWTQCAIVVGWVATYASTIGPLTYTIVSEMSATRLRSQSLALGRNTYNIVSLISNIIQPYLINPGEGNLKGKTGFFWFGTAFPTLVWAYFRLPETKDRTYEELDILFDRRISARKFSSTDVDRDAVEIDRD